MESVAVVTLILATLIIAAAALGLSRVIIHLSTTAKALEALLGGVGVIVAKTDPVPPSVDAVNDMLAPVRDFAESI